jgi:hypothetical protein
MTKHLLTGVAAVVLMSAVASAQVYPPAPPPVAPPVTLPPPAPGPGSSTTTVVPAPDEGYRESTIKKGVGPEGAEITKKDTYREGAGGSTETHIKKETDPLGSTTTTRSTTTTTPR